MAKTSKVIPIIALIAGVVLVLMNLGSVIEMLLVALGVLLILYGYHVLSGKPLPKFMR